MPDTVKTRAALLTELADNAVGAITPQVIRDVLVSTFGVFGSIYADGTGTQTVATPTANTLFTAAGVAGGGVTMDPTNARLTVPVDGTYLVWLLGSVIHAAAGTFDTYIYKNESPFGQTLNGRTQATAAQHLTHALLAPQTLAANDRIACFIQSGVGAFQWVPGATLGVLKIA